MSLIEPLGVRILGVDFKESHLEAISKAIVEAVYAPEEIIGKIAVRVFKFGDLLSDDEQFLSATNPEALRKLFESSGLNELEHFFLHFLDSLSKNKALVNLLAGFGTVTTEPGSLRIKFRNHAKEIEEIKVNIQKLWQAIRKHETEIKNSFNHLAEFASRIKDQFSSRVVHIGLYGAAFVLVVLSLWYSVAFGVASGLSTIAQNLLRNLKGAWPIISFALFIICSIYGVMEVPQKLNDAIEAAKKFYGGS